MKKLFASIATINISSTRVTRAPYVTNISSDGNNGINVEKCTVEFNSFTGNVSTGNCTTQSIRLSRQ